MSRFLTVSQISIKLLLLYGFSIYGLYSWFVPNDEINCPNDMLFTIFKSKITNNFIRTSQVGPNWLR